MRFLVTGAAGFIGFHTCSALCREGATVLGIDNFDPYYDPALKTARLAELRSCSNFQFQSGDILERRLMADAVRAFRPTNVVHLAAKVGVRASLERPDAYVQTNVTGFLNVLETCRSAGVQRLVYASSSSVYGDSAPGTDAPLSVYAATKKSNELLAHAYTHLYGLETVGLRFFTVYGPWGRPDMAPMLFARALLDGRPLDLFNGGELSRDFTYIDDIVGGIVAAARSGLARRASVYDLGGGSPFKVTDFVDLLGNALGVAPSASNRLAHQPGDVRETAADNAPALRDLGWNPRVSFENGVQRFADWYVSHYPRARKATA